MYEFKTNKETKALEIIETMSNCHQAIISQKDFDAVFTREYARFEYYSLLARVNNGKGNEDDEKKLALLENHFNLKDTAINSVFDGIDEILRPRMVAQLYAHGKLLETYGQNEDGDYFIKAPKLSFGMEEFYHACCKIIPSVENGSSTLEDGVKLVKPLYYGTSSILDHDAKDGVCKKWEESKKEKNVRAFLIGLLSRYKLTRLNKIKGESPLKSLATFEKYVLMWLITGGAMVEKKTKTHNDTETFGSFCGKQSTGKKKSTK